MIAKSFMNTWREPCEQKRWLQSWFLILLSFAMRRNWMHRSTGVCNSRFRRTELLSLDGDIVIGTIGPVAVEICCCCLCFLAFNGASSLSNIYLNSGACGVGSHQSWLTKNTGGNSRCPADEFIDLWLRRRRYNFTINNMPKTNRWVWDEEMTFRNSSHKCSVISVQMNFQPIQRAVSMAREASSDGKTTKAKFTPRGCWFLWPCCPRCLIFLLDVYLAVLCVFLKISSKESHGMQTYFSQKWCLIPFVWGSTFQNKKTTFL